MFNDNDDDDDLQLLLIALKALSLQLGSLERELHDLLQSSEHSEAQRKSATRSTKRKQTNTTKYPSWATLQDSLPDRIFKRKLLFIIFAREFDYTRLAPSFKSL